MWGSQMVGGDPVAGGLLGPDGAHEQIARWRGRVGRMAIATQDMSARLRDLRLTATDAAGVVEVTVDASGRLGDLRLTERIRRMPPEAVASTIMQTIAAALGQLSGRAQEIIAETIGVDSPAAQEISERGAEQLRPGDA